MKTKELIEYLQGFDAESEVVVIAANPKERKKYDGEMFGITDGGQPIFCIEISNESDLNEKARRQQYRMKERQSRNEFEICKAKRGHGADQRGIVGGLERETVTGIEVAASHSERRQQKQDRGGQTEADGSEGRCL